MNITPGQVADARKDLGRQLAAWRKAAGLTQTALASLVSYSRSTVGNVEVGRQGIPRRFWEQCDRVLGAGGAVLAAGRAREGEVASSVGSPRPVGNGPVPRQVEARRSRAPGLHRSDGKRARQCR